MRYFPKKRDKLFEKDVENLNSYIEPWKLTLTWNLENIEDVKRIQILRKPVNTKNFQKVKEISKYKKSFEIELPPFSTFIYKVRLVSITGKISKGKTIKTTGIHKSVILDNFFGRNLQIYLPPSYFSSNNYYPVVYMLDGQNLFTTGTSSFGEWRVDIALDELIEYGYVSEMIVVGIYNSGETRGNEYVPYEDEEAEVKESRINEFSYTLINYLIPYIDNKYRTIPNRDNRAIIGSSFGGIAAFWIGYNNSDIFSSIGALSPSFWIADRQMFKDIHNSAPPDNELNIWYDIGTLEWDDYTELIDILIEKGFVYGKNLFYYEVKDADHNELAWSERIYYPLIMFKGRTPKEIVDFYVDVEVIKDDLFEEIYLRLNPIIELDNGIKYSLYKFVEYELLNEEAGIIYEDGYFEFNSNDDLEVIVRYENIEKQIIVNYDEIQDRIEELMVL